MANVNLIVVELGKSEFGYFAKLQNKTVATAIIQGLGTQERKSQLTYYYPFNVLANAKADMSEAQEAKLFAKLQADMVGVERVIDPDNFDVEFKEFTLPNGEVIETKWLKAKR